MGAREPACASACWRRRRPPLAHARLAQATPPRAARSLQASERSIDLMQRIAKKLHQEKAWDQSVYNEYIFFLSHGEYKSPQARAGGGGARARVVGWGGVEG